LPRDRGASEEHSAKDETRGTELAIVEYPTYPDASTEEIVDDFGFVLVMRVVGRDEPRAQPQSRYAGARESDTRGEPIEEQATGGGRPDIVRPVRFEVERVIQGTFEECAAFDVPGGTVGRDSLVTPLFPTRIRLGDKVLAFGLGDVDDPTAPRRIQHMVLTAEDGTVTIPFGDRETVDADTWEP
jgi:hypothetical protein